MSDVAIIESVVLRDCGRGVERLARYVLGDLERAARATGGALGVGIVTGFAVPTPGGPAPESDGPLGAAALAAYIQAQGRPVVLLTDDINSDVCRAAVDAYCEESSEVVVRVVDDAADIDLAEAELIETGISTLVYIERLGPNSAGRYLSMSGIDMTGVTVPLDQLADRFASIGIGDGGNEVGMGRIPHDAVRDEIHRGEDIHCVIPTDHLILAGVSNWGGWALVAAGAALDENTRDAASAALSSDRWRAALHRATEAGAVDGVRLAPSLSVDGMDVEIHDAILTALRVLALSSSR